MRRGDSDSILGASNIDKKPNETVLKKMLSKAKDKKARNKLVLKAYEEDYSQHMVAKVLGLAQPTVYGIIKRTKEAKGSR